MAPAASPAPSVADLGKRAVAERGMIASAHPLASEAGLAMLREGGNAVDAAVATAFALGVVEPMMGSLGGGGSLLSWSPTRGADYLDFYARAPAAPDLSFPAYDGPPHTPRAVAVPGAVAGLLEAHERLGRLPRARLLAPAIQLAEEGFPVSPLLARTIAADSAKLVQDPNSRRLLWAGHRPLGAGERLVQPELAATLRRIAAEGRDGFHRGPVAREVVEVLNRGGNPITLEDLAGFTPLWKRPLCGTYRERVVLSAPPPQSGMQILQTLNLLEPHDLAALGHPSRSAAAFHVLASALRAATIDRMAYLGDPAHVEVPAAGLVSKGYARDRADAASSAPGRAAERVLPGDPWAHEDDAPQDACAPLDPFPAEASAPPAPRAAVEVDDREDGETTHLSVVDAEGNAVALTFTLGAYFGTGTWAAGTFLNNAMSIFSDDPESLNALAPGRAPGSTTTPTIFLEDGRVRLVVGSPGGGRIPPAVVQAIVNTLDYGLDPLDALRMPRIHPFVDTPEVPFEQGVSGAVLGEARAMGYVPEAMPPADLYFGGVHLIERRGGRWVGAADPRRDGEVRGH